MDASPRSVPEAEDLLRRSGRSAAAADAPAAGRRDCRDDGRELPGHGVSFDAQLVRLGTAVHDAGKILHPGELDGRGAQHEPDGERLLVEHGVDPLVARCCLSHARWAEMDCSLTELLVALADKLWKGARHGSLSAA